MLWPPGWPAPLFRPDDRKLAMGYNWDTASPPLPTQGYPRACRRSPGPEVEPEACALRSLEQLQVLGMGNRHIIRNEYREYVIPVIKIQNVLVASSRGHWGSRAVS